jgi:nucleotide-binding universal stress UspA family protein
MIPMEINPLYKRLLLAVDGGGTSDRALQEAIRLASNPQSVLRIVFVVDEAGIFTNAELADRTALEKSWVHKGRLALHAAQRQAQAAGVKVETKLIETENLGDALATAIIEESESWPADLVILGTHGRKGLKHLLLGSVAEGVIRDSQIPILLVRNP